MTQNPFAALVARNRAASQQAPAQQASDPVPAGASGPSSGAGIPPEVESMIAQLIDDDEAPGADAPEAQGQAAPVPAVEQQAAVPTRLALLEAVAATAVPHTRLFVLDDAGSGQMNRILSGVVGTVDAGGQFAIHPDYKQLSYLFTLAEVGQLPVHEGMPDHSSLVPMDVPSDAVPAFQASMIANSSKHWSSLYESVLGNVSMGAVGVGAAMIQQERANTERAVANYLNQTGLTKWTVPIVYEASIFEEDPSCRPQSQRELMAAAVGLHNLQVAPNRDPWPTPLDGAQEIVEQAGAVDQPAAWNDHRGALSLVLEGEVTVYASSAAVAAQVGKALLDLHARARNLPDLHVQADTVISVELEAPTPDDGDRYF